jgi:hypothetical protein
MQATWNRHWIYRPADMQNKYLFQKIVLSLIISACFWFACKTKKPQANASGLFETSLNSSAFYEASV